MSVQQSYDPHHLHHHYSSHHSTLFPSAIDDEIRESDIRIDDAINSTVNIIGLLAALLVSVVIIVGVAFVIRTIRKRQSTQDESDEESPSQDKSASIVAVEKIVPTQGAPAVDEEGNAEESSSPQVFTISFTEVPMKRQGPLIRLVPKPLRPKPKPVDIEKLKRELGQIYVY